MSALFLRKGQTKAKGFTLIEVLVAVAILAFMIPALMLLMMQQTDSAGALRDKSIALWIAENKATKLHWDRTFLKQIPQRETTETVEMAGAEWKVDLDITQTELGILVQYTIKVSRDSDEPIIVLDLFLDKA